MELTLTVLGLFLSLLGFAGAILPAIPGPPISYVALLVLSYARGWSTFGTPFLVVAGILTLAVSVLDWVIPPAGAKKYGASRYGFWGSLIGMALGTIFFSFLGVVVGGWLGAVGGELYAGKRGRAALRAGWGAVIGQVLSIGLKMAFCGALVLIYVRAMLQTG